MMEKRGCTANILLYVKNELICANAGDSRCVVAEGGKAIPLSEDHKPGQKKELERILAAGSTVNEEGRIDGNLNLSRAIGDIQHKKNLSIRLQDQAITSMPDVRRYTVNENTDFAVIGCDGIWDTMSS